MATKQELEGLQKLASQYGGTDSQQFKDYVNQTAGTGTYDRLMAGLKNQASVQTAPAPVSNVGKIDTTTGQEVQQPIQNQSITTPTPTQAPNIPQFIQEAPKAEIQAPKVEVKTDINEALNPKWQQGVDKALESGQNVKTKLDEGLKAGTIDQTTYNQANNYLKQKEQVAGDQKAQQLNDENFIFQALQTGQNIKGTTPAYFKAKSRYDIASKYQSLTEEQLYNAYINGEISGQLEKDIAGNPYLAIAKDKFNKRLVTDNINQEASYMLNAYNKANGKTTVVKTEKTALETLNEKFLNLFNNMGKSEDEIISFKEHLANNYPSLVEETRELNAKNKQVRELADERDARLDEIIKENPGISINRATMLAARQNKDINNQIKSLSYEVANLSANIQYQTSMADKEYGYLLQEQSRQDQLEAEQRGYMFNMLQDEVGYQRNLEAEERQRQFQLEDRAYNEQLAQKQLEQKFAYEYGDINSTDPNVQRVAFERIAKDLQNQYQGMPFRRTVSEMAMDFMNEYKNGKSLSDISKETTQAIQGSPAYNQWAVTKGLTAKPDSQSTTQDWAKLDDTTLYNSKTGETKKITSGTGIVGNVIVTAGTTNNRPDRNNNPGNVKIGDVGYGVDNQNHTIFGSVEDGYQAMVNDINAKLTGGSKHKSKLTGQKLTTESTLADLGSIYAEDPKWASSVAKLSGYNTLTKLKDIDVNKLAPAIAKQEGFTGSIKAVDKTNEPLTDKQFTQSNQIITSFKADPQVKAFEEAYSQGLNLLSSLNDKSGPGDIASIFQFMKTLDPQSVVRETEFDIAAKSAGVTEYLGNTWDRLTKGKKLTDKQAEAFGKLAKEFIKNKATLYDTKYKDGIKRLEQQGIDTNVFPTSIADEMRKQLEGNIQNQAISNNSSDDEIINYITNQNR